VYYESKYIKIVYLNNSNSFFFKKIKKKKKKKKKNKFNIYKTINI